MIGIEFNPLPGKKAGETAYAVTAACLKRDLLILNCGPYDTMRLIPALNVSSDLLDEALDIFDAAIGDAIAGTH